MIIIVPISDGQLTTLFLLTKFKLKSVVKLIVATNFKISLAKLI